MSNAHQGIAFTDAVMAFFRLDHWPAFATVRSKYL